MTTFSTSLTNFSVLLLQSYDCCYCPSRRIVTHPPLRLQKHTDIPTHDFEHSPELWQHSRLLTLPASEAGDVMEIILLYTTDRIWVKWRTKRPGHLTSRRNISDSHWVTSCVGHKSGLGAVKKKTLAPAGSVNMVARLSTLHPVTLLTEASKLTVL
jgi:hypothetical protein